MGRVSSLNLGELLVVREIGCRKQVLRKGEVYMRAVGESFGLMVVDVTVWSKENMTLP